MGISKKIWEHITTDCADCETPCEKTSDEVVICMDKRYDMGTYNQDHLKAVRLASGSLTIPVVKIMKDGRITIYKTIRESYNITEGSLWKLTLEKVKVKD